VGGFNVVGAQKSWFWERWRFLFRRRSDASRAETRRKSLVKNPQLSDVTRSAGTHVAPADRALGRAWARHAYAGAVLLVFACVLLAIAHLRGVDGDEPYYAAAIDNVARGRHLYVDFFHPQAPVQPLLYGLFFHWGLEGIQGLRVLSVGCCVVTGVVWWRLLTRLMPRGAALPLCLLTMALADGSYLAWGASLKTYPLTTMFTALGAYTWWEGSRRGAPRTRAAWLAASGLAWTLAAGARASFAAPVALFSLVLLVGAVRDVFARRRLGLARFGGWCVGAAAGTGVTVREWLRDRAAFWFDNVTAQALRGVPPRGPARLEYLFYTLHDSIIQYPWLTFVIVAGTASAVMLASTTDDDGGASKSLVLLPLAGCVYVAAMLALYPQYGQYYEGALGAFFVPCIFACMARFAPALPAGTLVLVTGLVLTIAARPLPSASGDVGRLDVLASVGSLIAKNSRPEDQIWGFHAFWAFQSRRRYVNGMECQFGYAAAQKLTAKERRHLHLLSVGEVADALAAGVPKIAVTDAGTWVLSYAPEDAKRVDAELARNYHVIYERDSIRVWLRNSEERPTTVTRGDADPTSGDSARLTSREPDGAADEDGVVSVGQERRARASADEREYQAEGDARDLNRQDQQDARGVRGPAGNREVREQPDRDHRDESARQRADDADARDEQARCDQVVEGGDPPDAVHDERDEAAHLRAAEDA